MPDVEPSEMLRFLLDQNGLSQRDIAEDWETKLPCRSFSPVTLLDP